MPSRVSSSSLKDDRRIINDEVTEKMFVQILQIQGVPKAVQEDLIVKMSLEKKLAMIEMHSQLLADSEASRLAQFTADDHLLLRSLNFEIPNSSTGVGALHGALSDNTKRKTTGQLLEILRTRLSTANREWLSSFCRAEGVVIIVDTARLRLLRDPFLSSDLWVLRSALDCLKRVANTVDGLQVLVDTKGALEVLAACMEPCHHLLRAPSLVAALAADILCVAVWVSESALQKVLDALDRLAKRRLESPFIFATKLMAKPSHDLLPAKRSLATLLNQLLMKTSDIEHRVAIRNAMKSAGVDVVLDASAAYHLEQKESIFFCFEADSCRFNKEDEYIESRKGDDIEDEGQKEVAAARRGEMVGTLVATKQRETYVNTMAKALGGKATKHRVYTLRDGVLSWAKEKGESDKHWIDMEEVLVVRPAARHPEINTPFALELVFAPPRMPLVLGVESQFDHDNWYLALRVSKRQATEREFDLLARGVGHHRGRRRSSTAAGLRRDGREETLAEVLHPEELHEHALALKKQADVFLAVAEADSSMLLQNMFPLTNVDPSDFTQIGQTLLRTASEAGATKDALRVFHELLYWSSNAKSWKLAHEVLRYTRSKGNLDENQSESWKSFNHELDQLTALARESEEKSVTASSTAPSDPLAKYHKMLQMHIPRPAVELKMRSEGVDPAELDAISTTSSKKIDDIPSKYTKYFKMLQMHIPRAAVELKMRAEGIDPAVLDGNSQDGGRVSTERPSSLKINENPMHAKYFKMLQMHIPRQAVEAKMRAEGISNVEVILDGINAESKEVKPTTPLSKKKATELNHLKSLFWDKITDVEGTLWATDVGMTANIDIDELSASFKKKGIELPQISVRKTATPVIHENSESENQEETKVRLYDGKRTQNVLIGLSRIKLSHEEIRRALYDADTQMLQALGTVSGVDLWLSLVPNDEELAVVRKYLKESNHSIQSLGTVEKFFATVGSVRQRLTALLELRRFDEAASDIRSKLVLLSRGATQIQCCFNAKESALQVVLRTILQVGNIMNAGTPRGEASGFRPDILPKLATIKSSSDSSQNLMHFIVKIIERSETPSLAPALGVDLNALAPAAAVDCTIELNRNIKALSSSVSLIKAEINNAKQDSPKFVEIASKFLASAEPVVSELRTEYENVKDKCLKLRSGFFGFNASIQHDEGCPIKIFFTILSSFVNAFETARLENVRRREQEEAQERRKAEFALRKARVKAQPPQPPPPLRPPAKDLFDAFHSTQTASVDEILAGFKQAHIAQLRTALDDDDDDDDDDLRESDYCPADWE